MTEVFWSCGWFLVAVCGGLVGWLWQALFIGDIHWMGQKVAGTVVFSPRITRQECPGILGDQKFARVDALKARVFSPKMMILLGVKRPMSNFIRWGALRKSAPTLGWHGARGCA